jgi:aerobic C4-dicarboxylate transport protein
VKRTHVQVLVGIAAGIVLGIVSPPWAVRMKPLGDAFVALLRMLLAPIIFCTVVHGIAGVRDVRALGRLGFRSLVYFEVVSTIGLLIGWALVTIAEPGAGLHVAASMEAGGVAAAATEDASSFTAVNFLLSIIPRTLVGAFAGGEILQVLFVSVLIGIALNVAVPRGSVILRAIEEGQLVVFRILGFVMRLAPIGAFGAMAAAVGANASETLLGLVRLLALYYAGCAIFVGLVLGAICRAIGVSLVSVLRLIREEIALVFGTASGEVAFPRLVQKLGRAGCDETVVGFVLPAGYSFNLDGTALYLALAVGFIAQATDTPFSAGQQAVVLGVLLLTSKGGTAVAGGAFVKLAATLQSVKVLPLSGLPLLFSVDRLMAIAIATTNIIGNTVAVLAIARWERAFDVARFEAFVRSGATIGDEPAPVAAAADSQAV